MRKLTTERLKELLPTICDSETSADPEGWTPENPLWGHCVVVALLVQELFGGVILRASLEDIPGFSQTDSHYWNKLPDGSEVDLTKEQFGDDYPIFEESVVRKFPHILFRPSKFKRYQLLKSCLAKAIKDGRLP